MDEGKRPVVAIDVDGVLNPDASSKQRSRLWYHEGWRRGRARLNAGNGGGTPLVVNPEFGVWLQKLARDASADLVWASRWNSYANTYVAPLAGLPALPYVVTPPYYRWDFNTKQKVRQPKSSSVVEFIGARPFVWFDDDPRELEEAAALVEPGQFLGVLADPKAGLTAENVEEARIWLSQLQ